MGMDRQISPFKCVVAANNELGECPRWDVARQRLYWIDINAPAIWTLDPATGLVGTLPVAENIGCFSLAEGGGFIAAMRTGVYLLDEHGSETAQLAVNPEPHERSRFNDGRCDAQGRLWTSTLDQEKPGARAHLYRYDQRGLQSQIGDIRTGNGTAFSPDGRWLYYSDTPRYCIYRHEYDMATGQIGAGGVWKQFEEGAGLGRPDGASVDAEGCYWSALFDGGKIVRLSPDGELLAEYHLPVQWPTMCAFGGPDLKTLYVTTSREKRTAAELAANPQSGHLFAMEVDVPGLPEPRFRMPAK